MEAARRARKKPPPAGWSAVGDIVAGAAGVGLIAACEHFA
jgi:hypothetical protein